MILIIQNTLELNIYGNTISLHSLFNQNYNNYYKLAQHVENDTNKHYIKYESYDNKE